MPRDIVTTPEDRAEAIAFVRKHFGANWPSTLNVEVSALAGLLAAARDAGYLQGWDAAFREAL